MKEEREGREIDEGGERKWGYYRGKYVFLFILVYYLVMYVMIFSNSVD